MPLVHGLEFSANQAELVKDLVRELLKDGNCAVYALHNMKPNGELRMVSMPTDVTKKAGRGVFLRIRPGAQVAMIVRPMNAKGGDKFTPVSKLTQSAMLTVIRTWRKQTALHVLPTMRAADRLDGPADSSQQR